MQTFVWLKSSHALGSKFTQKWQKSKRIVQYVWKKSCFSFFGNFLDEIISVNKIKNQENFFCNKKISFSGFNTVMWGSPRLEPSILAMKNCKINFWDTKSILHCDRFFWDFFFTDEIAAVSKFRITLYTFES